MDRTFWIFPKMSKKLLELINTYLISIIYS